MIGNQNKNLRVSQEGRATLMVRHALLGSA